MVASHLTRILPSLLQSCTELVLSDGEFVGIQGLVELLHIFKKTHLLICSFIGILHPFIVLP